MPVWLCLMVMCLPASAVLAEETSAINEKIIATVNSRKITGRELQLDFFLKQLSASSVSPTKETLIEQLIDRELIRQFLVKRKVKADSILLEQQMKMIRRLVEKKESDLKTVLVAVGLDEESLEEMLSLQIAWKIHVTKTLTEKRIHEYWNEHKSQFDGTEVIASQIFKKLPSDASNEDVATAKQELTELRKRIVAGEITFAAAAKENSDSPSASKGGSLGTFEYAGMVAESIAITAFGMQPGDVSKPFRSRFGLHLLSVEKRVEGELSLEDARSLVVKEISSVMWKEQVARERKTARIRIEP